MLINNIVFSIFIGFTTGYIYGLAFVAQQKRVFLGTGQRTSITVLFAIMNPIIRLIVLALGFYYLVFCSFTNTLIVLGSFIAGFWYQLLLTYR